MKRTLSLCCAALLSCLMTCPALAADALLLMPSLYPTEVKEYANGEEMRLERTYLLSSADDPANIPVGDFDREGWHYMRIGSSIIPFINEFPRDSELYRLMSTTPGDK